ncbi:Rho termination factor N-terminal domain-containing protein [Shouchella lehensis]|uniref:Rho termination factor-like N-terminal domain-containing protein n=1 Tax=Shouchella lehensis TaxID=300825 RepID=A0A4Y7WEQ0_9BACI|nr:Rho termination factor N-terminal domain-containing protein [Shouchella lehensis]MBG9783582.1 hypothetical protein [Shouchella lehensis]TES45662.1 hypothetical protein E2L03_19970 [Shouchella lehensis]
MSNWIRNTKSNKIWFVDEEQAERWLKEDHIQLCSGDSSQVKKVEQVKKGNFAIKSLKALQAEAREIGVPNYSSMNKQQLEKAIGDADGAE